MGGRSTCRECGKLVARGARVCPHCGARHPTRGKLEHGVRQMVNGLLAAGFLIALLTMCVVVL